MFEQIVYIVFFVLIGEMVLTALYLFIRALMVDLQPSSNETVTAYGVVLYAHNNEADIMRCLQSVVGRKIVLVDNQSRDATVALARSYKKNNCDVEFRIIAKKKMSTRATALTQGVRACSSEHVLVMDADCVLQSQKFFGSVEAIIPNVRLRHGFRLNGRAMQLQNLMSFNARKSGLYRFAQTRYNHAALYKRKVVMKLAAKKPTILDDIRVLQKHTHVNFSETSIVSAGYRRNRFSILAFLRSLTVLYMTYVALRFEVYDYLLLALLSFGVVLLLNMLSDHSMGVLKKLRQLLLGLPLYSLVVIRSLIYSIKHKHPQP